MRAVGHALRQQMIETIESNQGGMTVTELYVAFRMEQSICSQHLAILRKEGIVKTERKGKYIYYSIDQDRMARILETFTALGKS